MLVLTVDTSSAAVTAALVELLHGQPRLVSQRVTVNARAHAEVLAPAIEAVLAEAFVTPRELHAVVVGVGPGPYTGLRVGLVTAAVLADLLAIPCYGVCSLDGIAGALQTEVTDVVVAADARRREVYWAHYRGGVRVSGPDVARPTDVDLGQAQVMAGAGARLYHAELGLTLLEQDYPDPLALVTVALDRIVTGAASEALVPLYLRRPDATEPGTPKQGSA